ncbi:MULTISPECIES: RHS repeat domain-containing protein [unclassified Polaribacter]|uniref:RHS repeat domain-containing protein n=1 Tax=unclassified Polaribacter TaxID=196858 RepID=UPI0011BD4B84|nr:MULTISPECIES: RHS repeat domain-containing protein [unclassified Polaribacter]TXD53599.1 RHS repeat protein [Polaribacter sp. IC063]TXD62160.1 RHS repeat protein [Polaribacter sp. IC066]
MKNRLLLSVLLCLTLLTSCGGNNEEDNLGDLPNVEKLITQVTVQNPEFPDYYNPDTFIYENGKLIKAWFYGQSGALSEFEYGANGKIETVYQKESVSYSDIDISIKTTGQITKQIYNGDGNLISITDNAGKVLCSLDYDSSGRFYKVDVKDYLIGKQETYIYSDFDTNGNPRKMNDPVTITYDNKVNPIYILFKKFGLFNVEMGNSLEGSRSGLYFSPNNIKEIIDADDSSEIFFSAIYSYDSDGYPISSSFNVDGGVSYSGVEIFDY